MPPEAREAKYSSIALRRVRFCLRRLCGSGRFVNGDLSLDSSHWAMCERSYLRHCQVQREKKIGSNHRLDIRVVVSRDDGVFKYHVADRANERSWGICRGVALVIFIFTAAAAAVNGSSIY